MAEITEETISRLGKLAALSDTEAESGLKTDLERVLAYVGKLNEVDTDGVDPMIQPQVYGENVLREDVVKKHSIAAGASMHGQNSSPGSGTTSSLSEAVSAGELTAAAPELRDGMFVVPRSI